MRKDGSPIPNRTTISQGGRKYRETYSQNISSNNALVMSRTKNTSNKRSPKNEKFQTKFKVLKKMKKTYGRKCNSRGNVGLSKMQYGTESSNMGRLTRDNFNSNEVTTGQFVLAESNAYNPNKRFTVPSND